MHIPNGLTVSQLKDIIKNWPEFDDNNNPIQVFIVNDEGYGVPVTHVNASQVSETDNRQCILFE